MSHEKKSYLTVCKQCIWIIRLEQKSRSKNRFEQIKYFWRSNFIKRTISGPKRFLLKKLQTKFRFQMSHNIFRVGDDQIRWFKVLKAAFLNFGSISTTFYSSLLRQYFGTKKLQSQNVTREKLGKALLCKKCPWHQCFFYLG